MPASDRQIIEDKKERENRVRWDLKSHTHFLCTVFDGYALARTTEMQAFTHRHRHTGSGRKSLSHPYHTPQMCSLRKAISIQHICIDILLYICIYHSQCLVYISGTREMMMMWFAVAHCVLCSVLCCKRKCNLLACSYSLSLSLSYCIASTRGIFSLGGGLCCACGKIRTHSPCKTANATGMSGWNDTAPPTTDHHIYTFAI